MIYRFLSLCLMVFLLNISASHAESISCESSDDLCSSFLYGDSTSLSHEKSPYWKGKRLVLLSEKEAWNEMKCLAYIGWAEARGDGAKGMEAVMWVILNRSNSSDYPESVCEIVSQRGQFTSFKNVSAKPLRKALKTGQMIPDLSDALTDSERFDEAKFIAWSLFKGRVRKDPTLGATHFIASHSRHRTQWTKRLVLTKVIASHSFFRGRSS